jgi:hypothetical protein
MKKNEILSFASKWMELENIILSKCMFPSYADFRSMAMWLDLGHMIRGEHTAGMGLGRKPKT